MKKKNNVIDFIVGLWPHLTSKHRFQLLWVFLLIIATSLVEMVSIGATLPFLMILSSPDVIFTNQDVAWIINFIGIYESKDLLIAITIIFSISAVAAGFMRILFLWFSNKVSYGIGSDLSVLIYRKILFQPYEAHMLRNTSEVINAIFNNTSIVTNSVTFLITMFGSLVMLASILYILLSINFIAVGISFGLIVLVYIVVIFFNKKKLLSNSKLISKNSKVVIKNIQEGLGGIRDVLLDGTQELYVLSYKVADMDLKSAIAHNQLLTGSPRYIVETCGMLLIAIFSFYIIVDSGADNFGVLMPLLGTIALGAQKILPILQQIYSTLSYINGSSSSLEEVLDLLAKDSPLQLKRNSNKLIFKEKISIENIFYSYPGSKKLALHDINLQINRGDCIGIIGQTGGGKSTFLDVIMGLLTPTSGCIKVDNVLIDISNIDYWQNLIAHVPQTIYLADATIAENIAFGVPKNLIDYERVFEAANNAQISEDIEDFDNKYQTIVGERGVRLSGGQRQRIGIARALYKKAPIIILDEATSALDEQTERNVMSRLHMLSESLTVVIVTHRISTLKNCNKVFEVNAGLLKVRYK